MHFVKRHDIVVSLSWSTNLSRFSVYLDFLISPVGYLSKNVPRGSTNKVHSKAAFLLITATVPTALTMHPSWWLSREGLHGKPQRLCEPVQIRKNPWGWLNTQAQGCNRWLPCVSRNGGRTDTRLLCHGVGGFSGRAKAVHTHLTRG